MLHDLFDIVMDMFGGRKNRRRSEEGDHRPGPLSVVDDFRGEDHSRQEHQRHDHDRDGGKDDRGRREGRARRASWADFT